MLQGRNGPDCAYLLTSCILRQDLRVLAASILHEPRAAHPVPALHAVDGDDETGLGAAHAAHEVLFTGKHDRTHEHALALSARPAHEHAPPPLRCAAPPSRSPPPATTSFEAEHLSA